MHLRVTSAQILLNYKKKTLDSIDMTQTQALSNRTINHLSQEEMFNARKCFGD